MEKEQREKINEALRRLEILSITLDKMKEQILHDETQKIIKLIRRGTKIICFEEAGMVAHGLMDEEIIDNIILTCDLCKKKVKMMNGIATANMNGSWQLICSKCERDDSVNKYPYPMALCVFFANSGSILAWIGHLGRKAWYDRDKFCRFLERLQVDGDCYATISKPLTGGQE